jgi:hypothetical protein
MSDLFPVPIAQSQLEQFKKQANILGEEIHVIIGGKVLRGNRALNLYAAAFGYSSYNAVTITSKGITISPGNKTLLMKYDLLLTMARNIENYFPLMNEAQAFQALLNVHNKSLPRSLGLEMTFAGSDMMGFIKEADKDLIEAVQSHSPFTDDALKSLRNEFPNRNIDTVIRCHLSNIKGTAEFRLSEPVISDFMLNSKSSKDGESAGVFSNAKVKLSLRDNSEDNALMSEHTNNKMDFSGVHKSKHLSLENKRFKVTAFIGQTGTNKTQCAIQSCSSVPVILSFNRLQSDVENYITLIKENILKSDSTPIIVDDGDVLLSHGATNLDEIIKLAKGHHKQLVVLFQSLDKHPISSLSHFTKVYFGKTCYESDYAFDERKDLDYRTFIDLSGDFENYDTFPILDVSLDEALAEINIIISP